jgi:hypothetical protein
MFTVALPAKKGNYQLEAALMKPGAAPVRSLWDFRIMTDKERNFQRKTE